MKVEKNQHEVQLLLNDPNGLVTHYQSIIEIVVAKFITRGFFKPEDKMEVVQNINEALLTRKMGSIQRNYNGSVLLSTYFSKVIYNHCLEMARGKKQAAKVESEGVLEQLRDTTISAEHRLILEDEVNRLGVILNGVIGRSLRLFLALKLYARIPIRKSDFQGMLFAEDALFEKFKKHFFEAYEEWNDKEVYKKSTPFLNKITSKNADADSMRKWLNMQIDKIIALQNGNPPRSAHSRETIRMLLQRFFDRQ